MRRSFLSLLRGADGRAIARALTCLLLVNAVVAGFVSGAAAAAPETVLCTIGIGSDNADPADTAHDTACCEMGCVPTTPALATTPDVLPERTAVRDICPAAIPDPPATPATRIAGHGPRGPPSLV